MDHRDFSDYSQRQIQNVHHFLKELSTQPPSETDKKITQIAKEKLEIQYPASLFVNPREAIVDSTKIWMRHVTEMKSLSEAQMELAGAINGLNILLKYETNQTKQMSLKKDISLMSEYEQQIRDIFLIKESIENEPTLKGLLHHPGFINDFRALRTLYGRKHMDVAIVRSFMRAWNHPQISPLLNHFVKAAQQARESNLQTLRKGNLPMIEDPPNHNLAKLPGGLLGAVTMLEKEDFQNLKSLIDDLFNNRAMITNTQVHKEGLNLTFNSQSNDTFSQRVHSSREKGIAQRQQMMEKALEAVHATSNQKQILKEARIWEKLSDGYIPRAGIFLFQKSMWKPEIGPKDPIQPLQRIIGFATKEGKPNETPTLLDFTQALGPENLQLSIDERQLLSELLFKCDSAIIHDPSVIGRWKESRKIPEEIQHVLDQFHNEKLPHLNTLSISQKEALITEALRFTFEVNYHLADDLLNLP